jgi:hypothetical protein
MEVLRSGLLGMDAQQAPSGHGCPFGARPRSNAGVREVGAKRGPGHRSEGPWLLGAFPSDPPEASPPGRQLSAATQ